jgi:hydrogenase 3 maturation protease
MSLREELAGFLGDGDRRVAVMGIGSPIRGDDAAGLLVVEELQGCGLRDVLLVSAETVPESFTGKIRGFGPTHVLMIDAADFRGAPGEARMIPKTVIGGSTISTHSMPLNVLIDFIEKTTRSRVALLGVQPKCTEFGAEVTPEIREASRKIASIICELLR